MDFNLLEFITHWYCWLYFFRVCRLYAKYTAFSRTWVNL